MTCGNIASLTRRFNAVIDVSNLNRTLVPKLIYIGLKSWMFEGFLLTALKGRVNGVFLGESLTIETDCKLKNEQKSPPR